MRSQDRAAARKNLDKRLDPLRDSASLARPPKGWVKAIRDALGMTAAQLAKRIGVATPRIYELEKSEVSGALTLESLRRAANAMDCQVVYALVPKEPLSETVARRALEQATARVGATAYSMRLEDQGVEERDQLQQIEALAKELEGSGSALWSEE